MPQQWLKPAPNMSRDLTPEDLEKLRQIRAAQAEPDAGQAYDSRAAEYERQAADLEKQGSAQYAPTGGVGGVLQMIAENFGRYGAPGGYAGQEQVRRQQFDQANTKTLNRAKELRGYGRDEKTLGQGARTNQRLQQNTAEDVRQFGITNERLSKPGTRTVETIDANGNKVTRIVQDVAGSEFRQPPDPVKQPGTRAVQTVDANGRPVTRIVEDTPGTEFPDQPSNTPTEPGTYMDLRNDQGVVIGAWNPKSGEFKAVPEAGTGLRRTAIPSGTNQKVAEYDNALQNISALGKAFKPEFVGPYQGRYEQSKAGGIMSIVPGFETSNEYATFAAAQATLKNYIIKLITGAQMGEQEADRIMKQIPTETDKDNVWQAKYTQTLANAQRMHAMIKQMNGVGGEQPAQPANNPTAVLPGGAVERLLRGGGPK